MSADTSTSPAELVHITPAAALFMKRMVRFGGQSAEAGFRLSVAPGGCSGMTSDFSIENEPRQGDRVLRSEGVKVFLPPFSFALLQGVTIDVVDSPTESGLVFRDPKASSCCSSTASENQPPAETP